jgi:Predicted phosphohydrolases
MTYNKEREDDDTDNMGVLLERRNLMDQSSVLETNARTTHPVIFQTPPTDSALEIPVKFAIVGDLGQTYNSTVTMLNILSATKRGMQSQGMTSSMLQSKQRELQKAKSILNHQQTPVSALLIAGDMSYANSIQPQWDNWFNLIQPIASRIPMMVAAGNHEIECDAETFVPFLAYENRFYMPNRIQEAKIDAVNERYRNGPWGCATPSEFMGNYDYGNAYYSFDYGMIKTIVLSSYSDTRKGSPQYNWLVKELNSVDRHKHPWLLVMMHTQFYTTFQAHNNEEQTTIMREAMEELFLEHGVNFVFSGHDHAYMRSKPMFRGKVVENGKAPIYIIVGEGGNREGHVKNYLHEEPEEWVAVRDKTVYGFGTLEVLNATQAQWKWNMGGVVNEFNDDVLFTNPYM